MAKIDYGYTIRKLRKEIKELEKENLILRKYIEERVK